MRRSCRAGSRATAARPSACRPATGRRSTVPVTTPRRWRSCRRARGSRPTSWRRSSIGCATTTWRCTSSAWPRGSTRSCRVRDRSSARCASAFDQGVTGPLLDRMFRGAIHAGRKVRAQTAIGEVPASVAAAAAALAEQLFGDLASCSVMLLGAGKTGELAAASLVARGRANRARREPLAGEGAGGGRALRRRGRGDGRGGRPAVRRRRRRCIHERPRLRARPRRRRADAAREKGTTALLHRHRRAARRRSRRPRAGRVLRLRHRRPRGGRHRLDPGPRRRGGEGGSDRRRRSAAVCRLARGAGSCARHRVASRRGRGDPRTGARARPRAPGEADGSGARRRGLDHGADRRQAPACTPRCG